MKLSSKAIKIKRNFVYRHQLTQYPRHCRDADTRTLCEIREKIEVRFVRVAICEKCD